jgi:hypothetical protein
MRALISGNTSGMEFRAAKPKRLNTPYLPEQ